MMPRPGPAPIVGVGGVIGVSSNAFGAGVGIVVLVGEAAVGTASRRVRRVTVPVQRHVVEPAARSVVDLGSREVRGALARADHLVDVLVPAAIAHPMSPRASPPPLGGNSPPHPVAGGGPPPPSPPPA